MKIYTNLNTNNLVNEIRKHLKGVTNKSYIKNVIICNYNYVLITKEEKDMLLKEFGV